MRKTGWFASVSLVSATCGLLALAGDPTGSLGPASRSVAGGGGAVTAGPRTPRTPSFQTNVLEAAKENTAFRRVLFTGKREQLVLMSIAPRTNIGEEVHPHVEQVFYVVSGTGKALVDGSPSTLSSGDLLIVTPGVRHDILNEGDQPLKLFTIYAPPSHLAGRVHMTKEDAEADTADEQFGHSVY